MQTQNDKSPLQFSLASLLGAMSVIALVLWAWPLLNWAALAIALPPLVGLTVGLLHGDRMVLLVGVGIGLCVSYFMLPGVE